MVASTTCSVIAQEEDNRSWEMAPSLAREPEHGCPTQGSRLLVAKTLIDLTDGGVRLRLFNPTDQPQTVYRDTIAAWCELVEGVSETSQQGPAAKRSTCW